LVTNATEGINAYLRSMTLCPGDELLTTNHVYNAVRQTMKHVARGSGAVYREIEIPLPIGSANQIVDAIAKNITAATRLIVIDHVTSPTALIFPVEQILAVCHDNHVDVLIDGAHAPGMLPLDIESLQPAAYAGNLHKWACAPKGAAFLWVRPDRQAAVHPATVSHFWGEGFAHEFDWQGTRDLSAWLTIPDALDFMAKIGWEKIRRHNHDMVMWAQEMLCDRWNVQPISPKDGSMTGSMASLPLPGRLASLGQEQGLPLSKSLYHEDRIEVPLMRFGDQVLIRICAQVYNQPQDYYRLAEAIDRRQHEIAS
jgi:isopenicillin-N epimerase